MSNKRDEFSKNIGETFDSESELLEYLSHSLSLNSDEDLGDFEDFDDFLEHYGVNGMKWGVRKDRPNVITTGQAKVSKAIAAVVPTVGTPMAVALLSASEKVYGQLMDADMRLGMQLSDPTKKLNVDEFVARVDHLSRMQTEYLKAVGITGSYLAGFGSVTSRALKTAIVPLSKAYGDVRKDIKKDIKNLNDRLDKGDGITPENYHSEVAKSVRTNIGRDKNKILSPFNTLAKGQLGLDKGALDIRFNELPDSKFINQMVITSPNGHVLVKNLKNPKSLRHDDGADDAAVRSVGVIDIHYVFDDEGYVADVFFPTVELLSAMAHDFPEGDPMDKFVVKHDVFNDFDDFLAHYGVKGMKWGVRKDRQVVGISNLMSGSGKVRTSTGLDKTASDTEIADVATATYNLHRDLITKHRDKLVKTMQDVDSKYDPWMLATNDTYVSKYNSEMSKVLTSFVQKRAPKGAKVVVESVDEDLIDLMVGTPAWHKEYLARQAKHDALSEVITTPVKLIRDSDGKVTDFELEVFEHSEHLEDFLEHYGVKGMKWGVRRTDSELSKAADKFGVNVEGALSKNVKLLKPRSDTKLSLVDEIGLKLLNKDIKKAHSAQARADLDVLKKISKLNEKDAKGYPKSGSVFDDERMLRSSIGMDEVSTKLHNTNHRSFLTEYEFSIYDENGRPSETRFAYLLDKSPDSNSSSKSGAKHSRTRSAIADLAGYAPDAALFLTHSIDDVESVDFGNFEEFGEFLEHYGVKGMKWGVISSDAELSRSSGGSSAERLKSKLRKKTGEVKKADSKTEDDDSLKVEKITPTAKLSADAESVARIAGKSPAEMSNRDLQEVVARAEKLKRYQDIFEKDDKSPLEKRVKELELEKRLRSLEAELNPPKERSVKKFIETASKGFETYQKIDQQLNGKLTDSIAGKLGYKPPVDKVAELKSSTEYLKLQKDALVARAELDKARVSTQADVNRTRARDGADAVGDLPSRAPLYEFAGKRSAVGRHAIRTIR